MVSELSVVKAHLPFYCHILQLNDIAKGFKLRAFGPAAEEDGERPECMGLQLLLVLFGHACVAVGEDDGFFEAVGEDQCLS